MKEIDIDKIAELAKLKIKGEERAEIKGEISAMISFADRLSELDTKGVPITTHVLPVQNVLRDDQVKPSLDRELILSNAPAAKEGFFFVPKVLGDKE